MSGLLPPRSTFDQQVSECNMLRLFEWDLMVSSPLRCLVRFTVRSQRCLQVVLYILAVFCFQIGGSFDGGIRPNYLLKIKLAGEKRSPLACVYGKPQYNGSAQERAPCTCPDDEETWLFVVFVERYNTHGILDDTLQKYSLAFRVRILHVVAVAVGSRKRDWTWATDASSLSRQRTPTSFPRVKRCSKTFKHQATVPFAKYDLPLREAYYLEPSRTKQVHRRWQFSNHSI